MKKILIVITRGNVGGAQMSVLNLAKEYKKQGASIVVAFGEGEFLKNELKKAGIEYVRFEHLRRTHNPIQNLKYVLELKHFLKDRKFHAVHFNSTNALFGAVAAKLVCREIKTIFTFRGLSLLDKRHEANFLLKKFYFYLFKFLLLFIDYPVYVSRENAEWGHKNKLTKGRRYIYNGINLNELRFFERDEAREELEKISGLNLKDKFVIGSIGRLEYPKNYEFLIGIFPDLLKRKKDACLVIIGEGGEREKYENLIKKHKLEKHVFLIGEIEKAGRFIKAFDLFTLVSKYEGLSITLIEAMASGVPILASMVGGNTEMLEHEKVQVFPCNNDRVFWEKFYSMFNGRCDVSEIGKGNIKKVKEFNIEKTVRLYLSLVKGEVGRK